LALAPKLRNSKPFLLLPKIAGLSEVVVRPQFSVINKMTWNVEMLEKREQAPALQTRVQRSS